ncbi:MAG: hypothetical protein IM658_05515 [Phenylobacterium sp.]|uniref:hypothetical protein n=1 Tax=Phenylobacterium sp. TaxID=1871053 RepID=UPI0025EC233F|nr:hypothetical protein [Phenylobacterium sp.]MCA3712707.1 hypothetical protein [Phenylobacterium sp.]MCA3747032.1 hypothetical protein [Phenylobacterium sp.]MCA3751320.1 hypothetical protein [Phenylobacterium sp.]MCA6238223.1 hypothetical protein [Phenylobacterium sp.]MCA6241958.1 hypothetical protein [Phenylobacterium sp.]
MSDLNARLHESRWEEAPAAFIASTQLDRLYRDTLCRLEASPSGLDVARELASDYLPPNGFGFYGSHKEGSGLPEDYWPRVALQYGAQGHLWSQCREGKLSLYVRGDDRYFRAPRDDLFELPATLDWEATFDRGILTGGGLPPVAWKGVHLLRPRIWVTDKEAGEALRALKVVLLNGSKLHQPTTAELEEAIRAVNHNQLPGQKRAWQNAKEIALERGWLVKKESVVALVRERAGSQYRVGRPRGK